NTFEDCIFTAQSPTGYSINLLYYSGSQLTFTRNNVGCTVENTGCKLYFTGTWSDITHNVFEKVHLSLFNARVSHFDNNEISSTATNTNAILAYGVKNSTINNNLIGVNEAAVGNQYLGIVLNGDGATLISEDNDIYFNLIFANAAGSYGIWETTGAGNNTLIGNNCKRVNGVGIKTVNANTVVVSSWNSSGTVPDFIT
ncbi:MAG: hypothetical protein WC325_10230, partial [Candidatus Bathyarchaeia archaeon]